jgi:hypothetical protein
MKTMLALILTLGLAASAATAKESASQQGVVVSMNAVPCGTQEKRHKKSREMLCHEYVLQTTSMEYHIREKEEKHSELLPIGEQAEFRIDKDKIKLRMGAGKGKEREFLVVSENKR